MEKVLKGGAAEVAPPHPTVVRNPRKSKLIRSAFDWSAKYGGIFLNSVLVLMSDPDKTISLLGI